MLLPREASHAYLHVFDPDSGFSSTSKCIVQDVKRVMNAWWGILKHKEITFLMIERHALHGRKRVRMEYNLALNDQEMRVDLCAVMDKHGGNITSRFAPNLFEIDGVQWHAENSEE